VGTGKLALGTGAVVSMSLTLVACSIPFCAMGLMMGALVKGNAAAGFANLVYLPGCYLSGMFFPLPASMQWQAAIWPQFHVSQLARNVVDAPAYETTLVALACVVGYTILFSLIAIWRLMKKG
jgi:ABC-2 type transport system permease protein